MDVWGVTLGENKRTKTVCVCVLFSPALWPHLFLQALSAEKGVELNGFSWSEEALEVGASAYCLLHCQQNTLTAPATAI